MASIFSNGCANVSEIRHLAVGGIHEFSAQDPCRIVGAQPEGAIIDLQWADSLALEAKSEGMAHVECGVVKIPIEMIRPVRLAIETVDVEPTKLIVGRQFRAQLRLYDHQNRELEVGKFTSFEWVCSPSLDVANDRSSGEFGFCVTCYGMHNFRPNSKGKATITAQLGDLTGSLEVIANVIHEQ
jgi:hypothetical protein